MRRLMEEPSLSSYQGDLLCLTTSAPFAASHLKSLTSPTKSKATS